MEEESQEDQDRRERDPSDGQIPDPLGQGRGGTWLEGRGQGACRRERLQRDTHSLGVC